MIPTPSQGYFEGKSLVRSYETTHPTTPDTTSQPPDQSNLAGPDINLPETLAAMRTFVLAVARVFRDDYVPPVHPRSKSADDLLPRTRAKDAPPGFQRRASAEGSTGWVTHEELLAHRHFTKCQRRALPDFPKLMSSWDF
jgi:hypothetical protein